MGHAALPMKNMNVYMIVNGENNPNKMRNWILIFKNDVNNTLLIHLVSIRLSTEEI